MSSTIGQRLKQAREAKHISVEKASEITRIRVGFLQALEAGDLSSLPSPVQARGFLRNYAEYLGLNFDQLLDELRAEAEPASGIIGPADVDQQMQDPIVESLISADQEVPTSTLPPKPKRRGRKKEDTQPVPVDVVQDAPASVETSTKRRARKKREAAVDNSALEAGTQPKPVVENVTGPQTEPAVESVSDENLWQNWLDRVQPLLASFSTRHDDSLPENNSVEVIGEETAASQPEEAQGESSSPKTSDEIFAEIGSELRKRREMLSLHHHEIERNIKVKAHYLEALEKGAFDDLPSTVQTRGMLSSYATFLDMDVDALLLRFADALQTRHRERNPQKASRRAGQPVIPANVPPLRSFIAGDLVFGVGMAALLIGFAIWGVGRVIAIRNERVVQPTAPSISDVLLSTPGSVSFTPTSTFLPAEEIPAEATVTIEIPTQSVDVNVQINIVAVERTYMRVTVDGKVAYDGRVIPGSAYPFDAADQIEILAGSGAALRVAYNGHDLGLMGDFGQVVDNIYNIEGVVTPTATIAPTGTPTRPVRTTPTFTPTFTPTSTPQPTNTEITVIP